MKTLVMIVVVQAVCATVVSSFSFSSPDCPAQAVPGVTLKVPDPNDCSKYSLCMQLFNMKLDCSEGQHFSAAAGKCLPAALAGCDPAAAMPQPQAAPQPAAPAAPAAPAPAPAAPAPAAIAV
uniref:Putative mucin peritrophin salivary protein n=1 Tax=Rhipicephalus microplus TaxID=6941 RepID=A0A6G5A682_RHIMP|nr:glutaconyl-CoA decarboxylase subunit gamma-like [Rhipicephalus microplus]